MERSRYDPPERPPSLPTWHCNGLLSEPEQGSPVGKQYTEYASSPLVADEHAESQRPPPRVLKTRADMGAYINGELYRPTTLLFRRDWIIQLILATETRRPQSKCCLHP